MGAPEQSFPDTARNTAQQSPPPRNPGGGGGGKPQRAATAQERRRGRRGRPDRPHPGAPPTPPRPRASASRRRKCCVAHFRVLSGRCRRESPVSPQLLPPPGVPEAGATSPPWPASKVGLGRWALEGWAAASRDVERSPHGPRTPPPGAGRAPRSPCSGCRPPPPRLGAEAGTVASGQGRRGRRLPGQPPLFAELGSLVPTTRPPPGE